MVLPVISKRKIFQTQDIDRNYLSHLLDGLRATPFHWLEWKDLLRSKKRPLSKENVIDEIVSWAAQEHIGKSNWSHETGIPFEISIGSWVEMDGSHFVGVEVKLGKNGGTYYYFCVKKRSDKVFTISED